MRNPANYFGRGRRQSARVPGQETVKFAVSVNVMNALLLPIVLGFLYLLARKALPKPWRLEGWYACWVVGLTISFTAALGAYAGVMGMWAQ
jgi:hypothetical protein